MRMRTGAKAHCLVLSVHAAVAANDLCVSPTGCFEVTQGHNTTHKRIDTRSESAHFDSICVCFMCTAKNGRIVWHVIHIVQGGPKEVTYLEYALIFANGR